MRKLYSFIFLILPLVLFAQNASDYFPNSTGYRWFYNVTPYDSNQVLQSSLSQARVDSFSTSVTFDGKAAKEVVSKFGPREIVLTIPYSDSNYINLQNADISVYFKSLPLGLDTGSIGGFLSGLRGWYTTYKLTSAVNSSYTIFNRDTNVTVNDIALIITFEVKAKRLADQSLTTPLGTFICKKFILNPAVKAKLAILPIISYTLLSLSDTVYIAPGNYIVLDNTPSAKVDLSLASLPSFWIPGIKIELLAPPAILNVNPLTLNVSSGAGDTSVFISNAGPGILKWKARVITGGDWLTLQDTMGLNSSNLEIAYSQNTTPAFRIGTIKIWDDSSFSPSQIVSITQVNPTEITSDTKNYSYTLYNNYPNPFNPSTMIKFSLKERSFVSLKVYNVLGKEVSDLLHGSKDAGIHEVQFNGSELSSGVYYYKLTAGNYTSIKKMLLLK